MLKRDKKAEFLEIGIVSMKYQFTTDTNYNKNPLSKSKYNQLMELQANDPIKVMEDDDSKISWWMFQEEFFIEDEELNADDLKAFALKGFRKNKKQPYGLKIEKTEARDNKEKITHRKAAEDAEKNVKKYED